MQRGTIGFPYPTGKNILTLGTAPGVNTGPAFNFKASIVLCDFKPGTRSITLVPGVYRVATVGAGGGASATAGLAPGGTTSWGATHQATGGAAAAAGGVGSGGDINTSGGSTASAPVLTGGTASGHRLGSAPDHSFAENKGGGGWSEPGFTNAAGLGGVDGFGLGIGPGTSMAMGNNQANNAAYVTTGAFYGSGAAPDQNGNPGIGGGAAGGGSGAQNGGPGGGGGGPGAGAFPGSGGGYSEKVITVLAATTFSYTVGAGGVASGSRGGSGLVIVEKLT